MVIFWSKNGNKRLVQRIVTASFSNVNRWWLELQNRLEEPGKWRTGSGLQEPGMGGTGSGSGLRVSGEPVWIVHL